MKIVCSVVFALFVFTNVWVHKEVNETKSEIQELKILIEKRTYLDSCYWDHLERCSFIHKDSIGVRRDGTLYDKYARKY